MSVFSLSDNVRYLRIAINEHRSDYDNIWWLSFMIPIRRFIEFQRFQIVKQLFGCWISSKVLLIWMLLNFQPFDSLSFKDYCSKSSLVLENNPPKLRKFLRTITCLSAESFEAWLLTLHSARKSNFKCIPVNKLHFKLNINLSSLSAAFITAVYVKRDRSNLCPDAPGLVFFQRAKDLRRTKPQQHTSIYMLIKQTPLMLHFKR